MFEDLGNKLYNVAAFFTGRGATSTLVALIAATEHSGYLPALGGFLPLAGLAVGMPVTAAMATVDHAHQTRKLRNEYRSEVAAALGIDPKAVTVDQLRLVATGDEKFGLPGNFVLRQAIERNDHQRTIAIGANVVAATATIGLLMAAPLGMSAVVLALAGSALSFGLDVALKQAGNWLFAEKGPSLDDRIGGIAHTLRRGQEITPSMLMGLVAEANPDVTQAITATYHKPYARLGAAQRHDILMNYSARYDLDNIALALNEGLLPPRELAFAVQGTRSGAFASPAELLAHPQETHLSAQTHHLDHVPGYQAAHRFAEHLRVTHGARSSEDGWATYLAERKELEQTAPTIH